MWSRKEYMKRHGLNEDQMDNCICNCEDYPCCGHSIEDRETTWEDLWKSHQRDMERINEERW